MVRFYFEKTIYFLSYMANLRLTVDVIRLEFTLSRLPPRRGTVSNTTIGGYTMSTILKSLSFDVFQVQPNGRGVLEKRYVGRVDGTSDVNARENALSDAETALKRLATFF